MNRDTFSEAVTTLRNATYNKVDAVEIRKNRRTVALFNILLQEGFLENIAESIPRRNDNTQQSFLFVRIKYCGTKRRSVITRISLISRPGLRIYVSYTEIPKIFNLFGLLILSTSFGILTDREAWYRKVGGEVICSVL